MKRFISFVIAVTMIVGSTSQALACTGTLIGKKMSADGSMILARTEDISSAHTKLFIAHERQVHKEGEMFVDEITGFKYPQPMISFKYTSCPDSETEEDGIYDEIGFNEYGVCISATISATLSEGAEAADPLVDDGLREANITTLVLTRAKTAKEGVNLLADIVKNQGSAEGNTRILADHDEM